MGNIYWVSQCTILNLPYWQGTIMFDDALWNTAIIKWTVDTRTNMRIHTYSMSCWNDLSQIQALLCFPAFMSNQPYHCNYSKVKLLKVVNYRTNLLPQEVTLLLSITHYNNFTVSTWVKPLLTSGLHLIVWPFGWKCVPHAC